MSSRPAAAVLAVAFGLLLAAYTPPAARAAVPYRHRWTHVELNSGPAASGHVRFRTPIWLAAGRWQVRQTVTDLKRGAVAENCHSAADVYEKAPRPGNGRWWHVTGWQQATWTYGQPPWHRVVSSATEVSIPRGGGFVWFAVWATVEAPGEVPAGATLRAACLVTGTVRRT